MSSMMGAGHGFESGAPSQRLTVLLGVIALHILIGYALLSGMDGHEMAAVNKPLQATIIQEVIIPLLPAPAPPPPKIPEAPKPKAAVVTMPPPAPRVPESPIQIAPTLTSPALTPAPAPPPATRATPAPATGTPATPAIPSAPAAPSSSSAPLAAAAVKPDVHIACPKQVAPQMPRQALRDGIQGAIKAQAVIRDGVVREVTILSGPAVFHGAVRRAMMQYECTQAPTEIVITQDFNFKFE